MFDEPEMAPRGDESSDKGGDAGAQGEPPVVAKPVRWFAIIGVDGEPGEILPAIFIKTQGIYGDEIAPILRATLEMIEGRGAPLTPTDFDFAVREEDLPFL